MRIWILAIAALAVLIGVAGGAYWYGGNGANESALVLNRAPAASDGIKVHGDWTLTVSNPDGSVDSVHEFENDLSDIGHGLLLLLMRGDEGIHKNDDGSYKWRIVFHSDVGLQESDSETLTAIDKTFAEDSSSAAHLKSLQDFRLTGNVIVPPQWGQLKRVYTAVIYTPSSITNLNLSSNADLWGKVTEKWFDPPIPVQPLQEVSATVRISFE